MSDTPSRRDEVREELAAEFAHHIDMIQREEAARGASPDAARAIALDRFGDQHRAARECERAIMGVSFMSNAKQIAGAIGLVAWRVGVAAALVLCTWLSWNANQRAIQASNLAGVTAQRMGLESPGALGLSIGERAAILKSVWGLTSGQVQISGAVKSPGSFPIDTDHPLDLATLIERAGGASDGATMIIWNQRGEPGEIFITLGNAQHFRGDFNTMPAPGSIITVK